MTRIELDGSGLEVKRCRGLTLPQSAWSLKVGPPPRLQFDVKDGDVEDWKRWRTRRRRRMARR